MKLIKISLLIFISILFSISIIEIILSNLFPQPRSDSWRVQNANGVYYNANNISARHEYFGKKEKISVNYKFGDNHNRIYSGIELKKGNNNILVIGDSIIFGWLLKDEDTFVYKLQKNFMDYNFINASAGGFSDSDGSIYIEEFCNLIKPKKIIFFLEVDRIFYNTLYTLDQNMNLVEGKVSINKLKKKLNDSVLYYFANKTHIFQLLKKTYIKFSSKTFINHPQKSINTSDKNSTNKIENKFILAKKIYTKIIKNVEKCGSEVIFVNLAWSKDTQLSEVKKKVIKEFPKIARNSKRSNFINLDKELKIIRDKRENYFLEEGHPNTDANEIIYQLLKVKLNEVLLVK